MLIPSSAGVGVPTIPGVPISNYTVISSNGIAETETIIGTDIPPFAHLTYFATFTVYIVLPILTFKRGRLV